MLSFLGERGGGGGEGTVLYCTALAGVVNKLNNIPESNRRLSTGVWRLSEDLHVLGNHFT